MKIEKWPWTRKGRERLAAAPRHQAAGASCVSSVILPGRSVIKLNDTISPPSNARQIAPSHQKKKKEKNKGQDEREAAVWMKEDGGRDAAVLG